MTDLCDFPAKPGARTRIFLRDLARRLDRGDYDRHGKHETILDVNGTVCGTFRLKDEDEEA